MNERDEMGRRAALRLLVGLTAAAPLAAACKGSTRFVCTDTSALTDAEKQARTTAAYVDVTPKPGDRCVDCTQWIPAAESGTCGGCKLIKGPVHPDGYCRVYARRS